MSSQALYRKYRSKNLDEIVGQRHIVEVLKNAVKEGKISHAYLFTGPRGTGKTSIARIFAHEINKAEYSHEKTHLDIIEIDAASNSGVDDMRALREKINSAPTSLDYKVYIIDEVHMLSGASFAALLKTIEEPPSHAIFILATTDLHKVPMTILSRVQKFFFRPIDLKEVVAHLTNICNKEKVKAEKEALELIAEASEGSMRDALSLLDQVSAKGGGVTLAVVQDSLGQTDQKALLELADLTLQNQSEQIISKLQEVLSLGADPKAVALQLYNQLKNKLSSYQELEILSQLLTIGGLNKPSLGLEIALLKLATLQNPTESRPQKPQTPELKSSSIAAIIETEVKPEEVVLTVPTKEILNPSKNPEDKATSKKDSPSGRLSGRDLSEKWSEVLSIVAKESPSLKAILAPAKLDLTEKNYTLKISFGYPMHIKMAEESKNKKLLLDAFTKIGLEAPKTNLHLDRSNSKSSRKKAPQNSSQEDNKPTAEADLSAIMGLMGGGEAVEI